MKKSVIMLSVLIFYTLVHSNVSIAGWVELSDDAFFDPSDIVYTKQDTIIIWFKDKLNQSQIYNRQIKAKDYYKPYDVYLENKESEYSGYNYRNYSDYSFSIEQFEYDCKNKLMRLTVEYDYDKYNRVINRTYDFQSILMPVVTDSKNEYYLNEVCNFAKNNEDKYGFYQHYYSMPKVLIPNINKRSGLWSTNPGQ